MGIEIHPYDTVSIEAVRAFNQRLMSGGCEFSFPESIEPSWLPKAEGQTIFQELYLAKEGEAVRGGYILKHQPFRVRDRETSVGYLRFPLSEGVVDARFNQVGLLLLASGLRRNPLLYSLGMGGFHHPYPMLLKAAGFRLAAVPFFFHVVHPKAFFHNIAYTRRTRWRRLALDFLAATGLGWVAATLGNALLARRFRWPPQAAFEPVQEFGAWVDELWTAARDQYSLVAVRDLRALNRLYPAEQSRFLKLKITLDGKPVGWTVMLDTPMTGHKHFGGMRVGSVVDCFARPGDEVLVAAAAKRFSISRGVDLLVTNQSHVAWRMAFARCGYLSGPSNFVFGASPRLTGEVVPADPSLDRIHFTRGDGDGPIHL